MFSSSVRRAALTAPSPPIATSLSHIAATAQASFSCQSHQRRFSSSKPSSPPADGVSETVIQARPSTEKKARGSKKKSKEDGGNEASGAKGRNESGQNLPSVPSTQHISPTHISASDFFSLYRPISLTNSFPKPITADAFASIFTTRTRTNKSSDVISTLSSTLERFDSLTGNMKKLKLDSPQAQWNEETDNLRASITADSYRKAEIKHLDGAGEDSVMDFPKHILSGKWHPFQPPPAPVPMDTADSLLAGAEAAEEPEPQHRTYTAVLTVEESTHANGEVTYMAHSTRLIAQDQPATRYLERMQMRYRERGEMMAISVKRQRKLKMKKHKYKKLMKRTRVLRRKLDRT